MSNTSIPLGDLCTVVGGGTPSRDVRQYYGGDILWVTPKDMKTWEIRDTQIKLTKAGLENSATRLVPENSVLVVVRSGVLKHTVPVAISRTEVAINQDMKAFICSERVDPDYLARFIKARSAEILQWVRATTADNFPVDKLKTLRISLPPLPEQRRIAEILDKADALRANRRAALAQLDTLTHSIFLDMFGRPISGEVSWRSQPLGEACEKITDGTHHSPPIQAAGIPYVTAKHLKEQGLDFFSDPWFVSDDDHRAIFSRCNPRLGDVLYIKDGATTGIAAVNPYEFEFSMLSSLALLRPNPNLLNPEFLCHWLNNAQVKRWILGGMAGAAIRRLTLAKIKAIRIPLPPLQRQEDFARRVARANQLRASHRSAHSELDSLFGSLQHRAFQGEL